MSKTFKEMSTKELKQYLKKNREDESAFLEYSSRFDWSKTQKLNSPEEEEQFIMNLIAERTQNK